MSDKNSKNNSDELRKMLRDEFLQNYYDRERLPKDFIDPKKKYNVHDSLFDKPPFGPDDPPKPPKTREVVAIKPDPEPACRVVVNQTALHWYKGKPFVFVNSPSGPVIIMGGQVTGTDGKGNVVITIDPDDDVWVSGPFGQKRMTGEELGEALGPTSKDGKGVPTLGIGQDFPGGIPGISLPGIFGQEPHLGEGIPRPLVEPQPDLPRPLIEPQPDLPKPLDEPHPGWDIPEMPGPDLRGPEIPNVWMSKAYNDPEYIDQVRDEVNAAKKHFTKMSEVPGYTLWSDISKDDAKLASEYLRMPLESYTAKKDSYLALLESKDVADAIGCGYVGAVEFDKNTNNIVQVRGKYNERLTGEYLDAFNAMKQQDNFMTREERFSKALDHANAFAEERGLAGSMKETMDLDY